MAIRRFNLMARRNPERLAEKLSTIRRELNLSQRGLIRRMGLTNELTQAEVSMFESGRRIPSLLVLREYAVLAGVWMDVLVSDDIDLPKKLPANPVSPGNKRKRQ
jgi:transcriptional regulator with XRE-family HTH domain